MLGKFTIVACLCITLFIGQSAAVTLLRNEGIYNSGLIKDHLEPGGVLEVLSGVKCFDGSCTRMTNNGVASKGSLSKIFSTVGYTDVTANLVVKTKLLDVEDWCARTKQFVISSLDKEKSQTT